MVDWRHSGEEEFTKEVDRDRPVKKLSGRNGC